MLVTSHPKLNRRRTANPSAVFLLRQPLPLLNPQPALPDLPPAWERFTGSQNRVWNTLPPFPFDLLGQLWCLLNQLRCLRDKLSGNPNLLASLVACSAFLVRWGIISRTSILLQARIFTLLCQLSLVFQELSADRSES